MENYVFEKRSGYLSLLCQAVEGGSSWATMMRERAWDMQLLTATRRDVPEACVTAPRGRGWWEAVENPVLTAPDISDSHTLRLP